MALIGCRSPQELFQLQNQLVKEQAELFAASIYASVLNQVRQSSDQVKAASSHFQTFGAKGRLSSSAQAALMEGTG